MEKDRLLEIFAQTGKFPADTETGGTGYVETEVKAFRWYEFLQIFAPIGLFALVLYSFYGQLPKSFLASVNKQITVAKNSAIQVIKGPELQKRVLAQGTKLLTEKPTIANQLVRAQIPALRAVGDQKGRRHLAQPNKPKPKALPPIATPQPSTVRKTAAKTPPKTPAKGKKNQSSKAVIKSKVSSSTGNQVAENPPKLKSNSKPPKVKSATISRSWTIR